MKKKYILTSNFSVNKEALKNLTKIVK